MSTPIWPAGWSLREARSWGARTRGLLGHRPLGDHEGLWLPVRSVHTVGMRFAIDLVWLDATGGVVRVDERVAPGRLRGCLRARGGVVEVAVGRAGALRAALAERASVAEGGRPVPAGGGGPTGTGAGRACRVGATGGAGRAAVGGSVGGGSEPGAGPEPAGRGALPAYSSPSSSWSWLRLRVPR